MPEAQTESMTITPLSPMQCYLEAEGRRQCIFRDDGSPCTNCSKRPPFPPVVCSINTRENRGHQYGGRILHIPFPASKSAIAENNVPLWESSNDGAELPPVANAEWLSVNLDSDPQSYRDDSTALQQGSGKPLHRSGTNLILDGRGDSSTLRPFGGVLAEVNTLGSISPCQTARNAELLHFCRFTFSSPSSLSFCSCTRHRVRRTSLT